MCVCVLAASVRASFHHHHLRHHRLIIAAITISPPSFDIFDNKILTEASKAPLRAVALASFLGDGFAALGSRAPPVKDLMAFGAVLHTNQHNIGKSTTINYCRRWGIIREIWEVILRLTICCVYGRGTCRDRGSFLKFIPIHILIKLLRISEKITSLMRISQAISVASGAQLSAKGKAGTSWCCITCSWSIIYLNDLEQYLCVTEI